MTENDQSVFWQNLAWITLDTARYLRARSDFRSCVSRTYYAVYQAATGACIAHGDKGKFQSNWSNPSHEQLPKLVQNHGHIPLQTRRQLVRILRNLRNAREDSDYRPGQTIDEQSARTALQSADTFFTLMRIKDV